MVHPSVFIQATVILFEVKGILSLKDTLFYLLQTLFPLGLLQDYYVNTHI